MGIDVSIYLSKKKLDKLKLRYEEFVSNTAFHYGVPLEQRELFDALMLPQPPWEELQKDDPKHLGECKLSPQKTREVLKEFIKSYNSILNLLDITYYDIFGPESIEEGQNKLKAIVKKQQLKANHLSIWKTIANLDLIIRILTFAVKNKAGIEVDW